MRSFGPPQKDRSPSNICPAGLPAGSRRAPSILIGTAFGGIMGKSRVALTELELIVKI